MGRTKVPVLLDRPTLCGLHPCSHDPEKARLFAFVAVLAALFLGAVLHDVSSAPRARRQGRFLALPAHEYPHEYPHPHAAVPSAPYATHLPMPGPR